MNKAPQGKHEKLYKAEIKSFDLEKKTVTAIVSTASVDRDKEIVAATAFQKRLSVYKEHAVLLSSHRYDQLTRQIGKAIDIKATSMGLEATFEYFVDKGNPEADWGFFLATQGIAAFSIGFIAHAWEDKSGEEGVWRVFTDVELMEISQVLVPSNRDALSARRSSEDAMEKEMVELAIKSIEKIAVRTEENPKPAAEEQVTPPAPAEDPKPKEVDLSEAVAKALKNPEFINELAEQVTQKLQASHGSYTDKLFSAPDAKRPQKEALRKEDVAEAFRDGISNLTKGN